MKTSVKIRFLLRHLQSKIHFIVTNLSNRLSPESNTLNFGGRMSKWLLSIIVTLTHFSIVALLRRGGGNRTREAQRQMLMRHPRYQLRTLRSFSNAIMRQCYNAIIIIVALTHFSIVALLLVATRESNPALWCFKPARSPRALCCLVSIL